MKHRWLIVSATSGLLMLTTILTGCSGSTSGAATPASTTAIATPTPPTSPTTPTTGQAQSPPALPTLYKIVHVTLSPSYSCQGTQGPLTYANTALFLSDTSKSMNAPELLFNGACGSSDYFDVNMAGDDMSLITDYGSVALTSWETDYAFFSTPQRQASKLASFAATSPVQVGHTYGVVINKAGGTTVRGLLYFTVTAYVPNQRVDLDYAVMDYRILNLQSQSPGFDWTAKPN